MIQTLAVKDAKKVCKDATVFGPIIQWMEELVQKMSRSNSRTKMESAVTPIAMGED